MQDIQVRICSVKLDRIDGETESSCFATRAEAEAFANYRLSNSIHTIQSITIHTVPHVIPNSPKRAWLKGREHGLCASDTGVSEFSTPATTIGAWSRETGWLFKDERAASRKPDATPSEEC